MSEAAQTPGPPGAPVPGEGQERPSAGEAGHVPAGFEERADAIAQRFEASDWIEFVAAVLLALATVLAAWAAYQSTRWSGQQADAYSVAAARRAEATQANSAYAAQAQIDVQVWITWLEQRQAGSDSGADFLAARFRDEFKPAFEAWLAQVPPGEIPPGTPFSLPEYAPAAKSHAAALNAEADDYSAQAREANQIGDNFVLAAVVMATAMFFAGVGTRFRGRGVRIAMLVLGLLLFLGATVFIFAMPQDVGV